MVLGDFFLAEKGRRFGFGRAVGADQRFGGQFSDVQQEKQESMDAHTKSSANCRKLSYTWVELCKESREKVRSPQAAMQARTVLLPKQDQPQSMAKTRPTTILGCLNRLWSRFITAWVVPIWSRDFPDGMTCGLQHVWLLRRLLSSHIRCCVETWKHTRKTGANTRKTSANTRTAGANTHKTSANPNNVTIGICKKPVFMKQVNFGSTFWIIGQK